MRDMKKNLPKNEHHNKCIRVNHKDGPVAVQYNQADHSINHIS